jgi:HEAT repeat protein
MKPIVCLPALAALMAAAFALELSAHGGQYRGPSAVAPPSSSGGNVPGSVGDVVPKSTGTGTTAKSGGSGSSSGAIPSAGSSAGPGPARGPRGMPIDDDLGRWEFWWEFGKDPYLRLREAIYAGAGSTSEDPLLGRSLPFRQRNSEPPTPADLARVAEALVGSLHKASDRDTISGCIVALAKIGRDGANWRLHDVLVPFLASADQELRETAALALGIAGTLQAESIALLCDLVADDPRARTASGGHAVNERTRAFAAYGLGLTLQRVRDAGPAHQVLTTLHRVLAAPDRHGRQLKVAAIEAMALFPGAWRAPAAAALRDAITSELGSYYSRDLGVGEQLIQAHVPPAMARLLDPSSAPAAAWKQRFAADLVAGAESKGKTHLGKQSNHIPQSCAIALGAMCQPWEDPQQGDAALGDQLLRAYHDHRDEQTRSFAILAIACMGGQQARKVLLREIGRANRAIEQPWCGVALGVLHARDVERAVASGNLPVPDPEVSRVLMSTLLSARNPASQSALAIAVGLCGDPESGDELQKVLQENRHRDDVAGYVALALGMLRDPRAIEDIRPLMRESIRRPFVLMQCVRGLGLLGDRTAVDDLCAELEQPEPSLVRLSAAASALSQIGDRRSLDPLLKMMQNPQLTPLTRAFAAVALGGICDKEPLPWNAVFATQTNYRASTETLTDGQSGILDIL